MSEKRKYALILRYLAKKKRKKSTEINILTSNTSAS